VTGKPSSFTPASHTHDYLPLTGGTLTGNLALGYTNQSTQPTTGIAILDTRSVNSTPGVGDNSVN
jgi:hypothetical protein